VAEGSVLVLRLGGDDVGESGAVPPVCLLHAPLALARSSGSSAEAQPKGDRRRCWKPFSARWSTV